MNRRSLLLMAVAAGLCAQLWYTFGAFHVHFPVRTTNIARITAQFAPYDLALYRAYLPRVFDMPSEPVVKVDFVEVTPTWHEAFVSLLVRHHGENAWYGVTWPIDAYFPYVLGYWVGYPKFIADAMSWQQTAHGFSGQVQHAGRTWLGLEYEPTAVATAPQQMATSEEPEPYLNLMPPMKGPQLNRLSHKFLYSTPTQLHEGSVLVTVDPRQRWARLISGTTERRAAGGLVRQHGSSYGFLSADRVTP